jgi:hypothetical protein
LPGSSCRCACMHTSDTFTALSNADIHLSHTISVVRTPLSVLVVSLGNLCCFLHFESYGVLHFVQMFVCWCSQWSNPSRCWSHKFQSPNPRKMLEIRNQRYQSV